MNKEFLKFAEIRLWNSLDLTKIFKPR